ncbi:MAG: hypothetical protein LBC95_00270 [Candidatus Nomurabacteria bacterium]|jgi:hypothetical protein|nr:hypothetical protein [Candidatus Nomurabacteria bacterium]
MPKDNPFIKDSAGSIPASKARESASRFKKSSNQPNPVDVSTSKLTIDDILQSGSVESVSESTFNTLPVAFAPGGRSQRRQSLAQSHGDHPDASREEQISAKPDFVIPEPIARMMVDDNSPESQDERLESAKSPAPSEYTSSEFQGSEVLDQRDSEPEEEITEDNNQKKPKNFLRRHCKTIITILLILICLIVLWTVDRNLRTVHLTMDASGLTMTMQRDDNGNEMPTGVPVRIMSYHADTSAPPELLYLVDTTATVHPASIDENRTMSVEWDIPDSARERSTYTEICTRDHGEADENLNDYCVHTQGSGADYQSIPEAKTDGYNKVSCTYYVPVHSVGLIAKWSGWNKFTDVQRVGCIGSAKSSDQTWGDTGFSQLCYNYAITSEKSSNLSGLVLYNLPQLIQDGQDYDLDLSKIINVLSTRDATEGSVVNIHKTKSSVGGRIGSGVIAPTAGTSGLICHSKGLVNMSYFEYQPPYY